MRALKAVALLLLSTAVSASDGDQLLASGDFQGAIRAFDSVIHSAPNDYLTLYKRSAAQLSLGKEAAALQDLDKVLEIKPDFDTALSRRARIYLRMGKYDNALKDARDDSIKHDIKVAKDAHNKALKAFKKKDYQACIDAASIAVEHAPANQELRAIRGESRIAVGMFREGVSDLSRCGITYSALEANILYYGLDDYNSASQQLRRCLQFDNEDKQCKEASRSIRKVEKKLSAVRKSRQETKLASGHPAWKEIEQVLVGEGLYKDIEARAVEVLTEQFVAQSSLLENLDEALCDSMYNQAKYKQGEAYCEKVLSRNPAYINAILLQADLALDEDDHEKAVRVLTSAFQSGVRDNRIQQKLQQAQVAQKRASQKDYYKILGVPKSADSKEIKKAYRQKTKEYHPDKYRGDLSAEEVESKMADINEAYEILSDDEARGKYDRGEDSNGHQGFGGFNANGFPGGFQFQQRRGGFPRGFQGRNFQGRNFQQFQGFPFGRFKFDL